MPKLVLTCRTASLFLEESNSSTFAVTSALTMPVPFTSRTNIPVSGVAVDVISSASLAVSNVTVTVPFAVDSVITFPKSTEPEVDGVVGVVTIGPAPGPPPPPGGAGFETVTFLIANSPLPPP
ncbi:hypothetical protein D3C73_862570 [compost metagenome]